MMRLSRSSVFMFAVVWCGIVFFGLSPVVAGERLHNDWSVLLGRHVKDGVVDYIGFKRDEAQLDQYLQFLDETQPEKLEEKARLAFYINAYNAYTVKLIIDNFEDGRPVSSIKELGGFFTGPWKVEFCKVGGRIYTLDNIEHDIIRPQFREPRVHFAINCASRSCPPLIAEAYEGDTLERQLEDNTVAFLNNKRFNYLDGSTLYISKIFKWFAEDFNHDARSFVARYAQGDMKQKMSELGKAIDVEYLEYDWSLNNK